MLTQLQTAKLVHKMVHGSLDAKTMDVYQSIINPIDFWKEVKNTFEKTTAVYVDHPLNVNMNIVQQKWGVPIELYDMFLNSNTPISVPVLLHTHPPQQAVSFQLLPVLLEQNSLDHPQNLENQLLCARLCMQNRWSTKNLDPGFVFTIPIPEITAMWKIAYTHLPEDELFAVPPQYSYFSCAVKDVFEVVGQRFPNLLGKLMNVALQERVNSQRSWLVASAIEEWGVLWSQLTTQHWADVVLPLQEHNDNLLAPFKQRALIGSILQNTPQQDLKRKM